MKDSRKSKASYTIPLFGYRTWVLNKPPNNACVGLHADSLQQGIRFDLFKV